VAHGAHFDEIAIFQSIPVMEREPVSGVVMLMAILFHKVDKGWHV
jgi:hypothetical protein